MIASVSPSVIKGTITAPASKSAMQRACAAALVRNGISVLHNPGISNDDKAALHIIQQLGAAVRTEGETVVVESKGVKPIASEIDCHESGLSIRMFTAIAATAKTPIAVKGSGSLAKRPMNFFDEVLPQLGVTYHSQKGYLPLMLTGPLQPRNITVDGSLSSQYLTGLLFAYAAASASDVTISVTALNSRPYVDLSLEVLKAFGLTVPDNRNYEAFYFPAAPAPATAPKINYTVEGDWSGGAFLLVAAAIAGDVLVKGLDLQSAQADKRIMQALMQAGALMSVETESIHIRQSRLKAFHFDATDCPDLFPPLAALAAYCDGTTVIEGTSRLTHKESNRAITLQEEFGKMGIKIQLQDNLMMIKGGTGVSNTNVSSHNDHRIAMAAAVAALKGKGTMQICGADAVNKSYPQFWDHLQQLGVSVQLETHLSEQQAEQV
jgi:3-phosphoshikimate 1-carboxyvinyltransferase